jgi:hypothetical protein
MSVYIGESDQWKGRSLAGAIVELCRKKGLAGAPVMRGIAGYGATSQIHTARIVDLSSDLPLIVQVVDSEERINEILPTINHMINGGLVTLEDVAICKYSNPSRKAV